MKKLLAMMRSPSGMARRFILPKRILGLAIAASAVVPSAHAERIDNKVAVFSALDKVTATIKTLTVPLNETREFGALKVTPRVCYSRPPTEQPKTTSFVEVQEVQLDGQEKKIFSGWMFAESPGLNAVEHPVFDVWLTGCEEPKNPVAATAPAEGVTDGVTDPTVGEAPVDDLPRRRRQALTRHSPHDDCRYSDLLIRVSHGTLRRRVRDATIQRSEHDVTAFLPRCCWGYRWPAPLRRTTWRPTSWSTP